MPKLCALLFLSVLLSTVMAKEDVTCLCPNTKEVNLVCASDNLTYTNPGEVSCVNKCEGKSLEVVDKKPCKCSCSPGTDIQPVCAEDGSTYANPNVIRCHNKCYYRKIKIIRDGPCNPDDETLTAVYPK